MYSPERVQLLIVDDDDDFRGTVMRRFARRGFRVEQATSGAEALDLSARKSFDVAIVDLMMPGMSGLELLSRLREAHPDCQVVMLTGQGTIETAVEAMKQGAYDFLTKPFPLGELEVVIEKAYSTIGCKRKTSNWPRPSNAPSRSRKSSASRPRCAKCSA